MINNIIGIPRFKVRDRDVYNKILNKLLKLAIALVSISPKGYFNLFHKYPSHNLNELIS
jgi:hypothetical protein